MPCDDELMSSEEKASTPDSPTITPGITRSSTAWSMGTYPKLSNFMGSFPDVAIFRRFGPLNVQNLLFLQAELSHLERELSVIRERESQSEDEKRQLALRSWWELSSSSFEGEEENPQWQVIQDIRQKLVEYSEDPSLLKKPSQVD